MKDFNNIADAIQFCSDNFNTQIWWKRWFKVTVNGQIMFIMVDDTGNEPIIQTEEPKNEIIII